MSSTLVETLTAAKEAVLPSVTPSLPHSNRSVPGSFNVPVTKFPRTTKPGPNVDAAKVASDIVEQLNQKLSQRDFWGASQLFLEDGAWRDHLALTWAFRTAQGPSKIAQFLGSSNGSKDGFRLRKISIDPSTAVRKPQMVAFDAHETSHGIQFFVTLETAVGSAVGLARLAEKDGQWRIFSLYTRLEEIRGHEETSGPRRPKGVEHGGKPGRLNWAERRAAAVDYSAGGEPAVLVVGAGQAGLTMAARLKMLGIDCLLIDQNGSVGDNWRKRYHQLVLHDPVWYDHMPYIPFPATWPVFTPKDKIGDFFEAYATLLELNVWMKTELVDTKYDEANKVWNVTVNRKRADGTAESRTFHPRHLVQATGHSGKKNHPMLKGAENFQGHRLCHSSEFPGARENAKGKKAIVVGSCNSAHDIAQDFLEKGYDITIVQRSTTHVVSSKAMADIALKSLYDEDGPPTDDADLLLHSNPLSVLKALQLQVWELQSKHDKKMLNGLAKAGFKVDAGPDGSGLFMKYFQRGGGYYIDVGASQLIADGNIKVKQGQEIDEVLPNGIRFADGVELEADEIVLATGYQNMRTQTRIMFGDAVADKVTDVWGLNEEGEMRTIWQRSGHPGFWFHGGNLALCRYYSKLLALQIKGIEAGLYQDGDV